MKTDDDDDLIEGIGLLVVAVYIVASILITGVFIMFAVR